MAWKYILSEDAIQIFLIAVLCHTAAPCLDSHEKAFLLNPYENGADVVQAVVSKLYSLHITMCDRRLLRRIALVETEDGTSTNFKPNHGGIWALDKIKFESVTKEVDEVLNSSKLCLHVSDSTPYNLMDQPLVSGLAATLYLNYLKNTMSVRIPLLGNITGQAQFWRTYYHSSDLTVNHFVERVKRFECKCGLLLAHNLKAY